MTKLLLWICDKSPALRRLLWRWWYSKLARQVTSDEWTFMNYGYCPNDGAAPKLSLKESDEADRLCIQLYEHVTRPVDLRGKDVLEVGSGRGGGSAYLARYRDPASMTGVDFSPKAVAFSARRHREIPNLRFIAGDAEKLPFPDAQFDAVVNVESSHCYGNIARFFSEAHRVLRPGGWFLFADLRVAGELRDLEAAIRAQPWKQLEEENISGNVLKALEVDDARKRALIDRLVPPAERERFSEFAAVAGSKVHGSLRDGALIYVRFAMRKSAGPSANRSTN